MTASVWGFGGGLVKTNLPGLPITSSSGKPERVLFGPGLEKNITTGVKKKGKLKFGAALGIGFELSFNPETFNRLAKGCDFIE